MPTTRQTLLLRLRNGADLASWEEFTAVYRPFLLRYALSCGLPEADACDVVQNIFVRLLRSLRTFEYDPDRGQFRNWLRRVARNSVQDWRRQRRRRREQSMDPEEIDRQHATGEGFDWQGEHRSQVVSHALTALQAECRPLTWLCFELHCLRGRTAADVANVTGLTPNGVYINAARTLARLRQKCALFDEDLQHAAAQQLS